MPALHGVRTMRTLLARPFLQNVQSTSISRTNGRRNDVDDNDRGDSGDDDSGDGSSSSSSSDEDQACSTSATFERGLLLAVGASVYAACLQEETRMRASAYPQRRLDFGVHVRNLKGRKRFRRYYRMNQPSFWKLMHLLRRFLERNRKYGALRTEHGVFPVECRVSIGLRMLGGGSYLDLEQLHGVPSTTLYSVLWEFVDAVLCTREIGPFSFPQTPVECEKFAGDFEKKSLGGVFRGVVSAADGLLVNMEAPSMASTLAVTSYYSGAKGKYGLNLQALATAKYRFAAASARAPGSTNDIVAWEGSKISKAVERLPDEYNVIGDAAYPLSEKLLTPYPGKNLPVDKDSFNFHLSQRRVKGGADVWNICVDMGDTLASTANEI